VLWAGKPRKNDIRIHLPDPVCCVLANLGKMMKLGFTYLFFWAGKPKKMMKLGFTYLFLCAGEPRKNDEIRFNYLFLWAAKPRKNDIRIH
jgi:hypothetical protein